MSSALVWFRDDLRLDDHLALHDALKAHPQAVVLVCVLDPRRWQAAKGLGSVRIPRLGPERARFWLESLAELRREAQEKGGELVIRVGDPVTEVPRLAAEIGAEVVYAEAHVADEEVRQQVALRQTLNLELRWGRTLTHPDDLPFSLEELPEVFTSFRKKVESGPPFRRPISAPDRLPALPSGLDPGVLPSFESQGGPSPSHRFFAQGGARAVIAGQDLILFGACH